MKNLDLIKLYPGWPWLLVPYQPSSPEKVRPAAAPVTTVSPAQPPAQSATGRPRSSGENPVAAIDWELAFRAKP